MDKTLQPLTPLQQQVLKVNDSYADKAKVLDMQFDNGALSAATVWDAAKAAREQGFTRQVALGGKIFRWFISNNMEALLHDFDRRLTTAFFEIPVLQTRQAHTVKINTMLDDVVATMQLAGYAFTKKEAKELLLKKKIPQNNTATAAANYYKCLTRINDTAAMDEVTPAYILQLHGALTKDVLTPKYSGKWRSNNKVDTGTIAAPAHIFPAKEIPAHIAWLCQFINQDKTPCFIHPIIKAALIEFFICYIRPFKDANARVARLLAQRYLLSRQYKLCAYLSAAHVIIKLKQAYFKTFTQVNNADGDVGYFIHFQLQALRMALKSFTDTHKKTVVEKKQVNVNGIIFNHRQSAILDWLKNEPEKIITIRELRTHFGISKETARLDLNELLQAQLLQTFRINKKTYAFVKAGGGIAAEN